jgi:hypothetical protein
MVRLKYSAILVAITLALLIVPAALGTPGPSPGAAVAQPPTRIKPPPPLHPPQKTAVPQREDGGGGGADRDDGPTPRPQSPSPVSTLYFYYTVSGDRVDVRLRNAGPDDAAGVCLKVWGSVTAARVEWGDARVRPGGADLCWHELYHDDETTGCFTVAGNDLDSYAELHWNGTYRVLSLGMENGDTARETTSQFARLRPRQ